ncbi:ribonuclease III, partial [Frankia casuarinae]
VLALGPPEYIVEEAGPDHAKRFTAYARIAGEPLGEGEGGSKKEAEQRAAAAAFAVLEERSALGREDGSGADVAGGNHEKSAVGSLDHDQVSGL